MAPWAHRPRIRATVPDFDSPEWASPIVHCLLPASHLWPTIRRPDVVGVAPNQPFSLGLRGHHPVPSRHGITLQLLVERRVPWAVGGHPRRALELPKAPVASSLSTAKRHVRLRRMGGPDKFPLGRCPPPLPPPVSRPPRRIAHRVLPACLRTEDHRRLAVSPNSAFRSRRLLSTTILPVSR